MSGFRPRLPWSVDATDGTTIWDAAEVWVADTQRNLTPTGKPTPREKMVAAFIVEAVNRSGEAS